MKILVLMPLDEKWSYIATELFKHLSEETKNNTFAMPMFTEWQLATGRMIVEQNGTATTDTKLPKNWNVATFGSIIKAREVYKMQESLNKDFLLIGNIAPDYKFDAIFNFQDPDQDMEYKDLYLEKLQEVFKDTPLINFLSAYDASASKMPLHNIEASAEFLDAYLKSDPHLEEIKNKYKDVLNFKGEFYD